jgi:hypothetical protein
MDARRAAQFLPRDKNDVEGAKALVALGPPAVDAVLPQMLEWLKTSGSPVELVLREFFVALGERAVPVVEQALGKRSDALKHAIVANVVARWPREALVPLRARLEQVASGSGDYGTDLIALRLLVEHRLGDEGWLAEWTRFKIERLATQLEQARRVEALLGR